MFLIEVVLNGAAALRFVDGRPHGRRDLVGVHDDKALGVSGGAADGLNEGRFAAEEALLVGVQNGDERHLRQVQALPQQVDAHQHIELAQPQVPDDLHPLDGLDVGVHIPHPDARVFEEFRQVLRHLFCQGGHPHYIGPRSFLAARWLISSIKSSI